MREPGAAAVAVPPRVGPLLLRASSAFRVSSYRWLCSSVCI